jgi:hypothetical protein
MRARRLKWFESCGSATHYDWLVENLFESCGSATQEDDTTYVCVDTIRTALRQPPLIPVAEIAPRVTPTPPSRFDF